MHNNNSIQFLKFFASITNGSNQSSQNKYTQGEIFELKIINKTLIINYRVSALYKILIIYLISYLFSFLITPTLPTIYCFLLLFNCNIIQTFLIDFVNSF